MNMEEMSKNFGVFEIEFDQLLYICCMCVCDWGKTRENKSGLCWTSF